MLRLIPLLALLVVCASAQNPFADPRLARYNDWKFGMFIHWGPYSQASCEASWPIMVPKDHQGPSEPDYRALAKTFNPTAFDPRAWVRLAKEAGQRYMVFTTKHHDGFCMFDTAYSSYKISNSPYKRDIVAQLSEAAKEEKMPLGFYYSPPDMNHPGYRDTARLSAETWRGQPERAEWPLYLDYMELQLRELLTSYGDVALIWFDGLDNQRKYDGHRFIKLIRELQPSALVNNRIGLPADYETPEQRIPKGVPTKKAYVYGITDKEDSGLSQAAPPIEDFRPWETCQTINGTWAYNKNDLRFKSAELLIRELIEVASKGGNYLLNVGPGPDGTIQPEFQERLRAIGAWLKVNGESIYGTTYGPYQQLQWGRSTAKGNTVYLHVFDWPAGGSIEITGVKTRSRSATLLAGNQPLKLTQSAGKVTIQLPAQAPDKAATVIRLQ